MNINHVFGKMRSTGIRHLEQKTDEKFLLRRNAENFANRDLTHTQDNRPIYDVRCGLVSIEFARSLEAAYSAFTPAAYPCVIWKLEHGLRKLVAAKLPPAFGRG